MHCTPASSEWSQACNPSRRGLQSRREASLPRQLSWSRKMGPVPWPKKAAGRNWVPTEKGDASQSLSDTKKATLRNVRSLPLYGSPSCWQTTAASSELKASSHTVPQALLTQISTLPSRGLVPSTSLISPSVQLANCVSSPIKISRLWIGTYFWVYEPLIGAHSLYKYDWPHYKRSHHM